jgi:hypothetical protein
MHYASMEEGKLKPILLQNARVLKDDSNINGKTGNLKNLKVEKTPQDTNKTPSPQKKLQFLGKKRSFTLRFRRKKKNK